VGTNGITEPGFSGCGRKKERDRKAQGKKGVVKGGNADNVGRGGGPMSLNGRTQMGKALHLRKIGESGSKGKSERNVRGRGGIILSIQGGREVQTTERPWAEWDVI